MDGRLENGKFTFANNAVYYCQSDGSWLEKRTCTKGVVKRCRDDVNKDKCSTNEVIDERTYGGYTCTYNGWIETSDMVSKKFTACPPSIIGGEYRCEDGNIYYCSKDEKSYVKSKFQCSEAIDGVKCKNYKRISPGFRNTYEKCEVLLDFICDYPRTTQYNKIIEYCHKKS